MRGLAAVPSEAIFFLTLCCCSPQIGDSALKAEQSLTASCQAWEERAKKAAHPNAAMIAQHDALLVKATKYADDAQAHYNDKALRDAAIGNQAQAEIEAAAIYDWKHDLEVAAQCWDDLKVEQAIHQQQREELAALAASLAAQQPAPSPPSTYMPPHSVYTLDTQPPPPPSPMPIPDLGSVYMPPPSPLPNSPTLPGPYLGHVPGGPDVHGVPAEAIPPPPVPQLQ
jgi:hypothetical protein